MKLDESAIEVRLVIKWRSKNGFFSESVGIGHLNHVFKAFRHFKPHNKNILMDAFIPPVEFDNKSLTEEKITKNMMSNWRVRCSIALDGSLYRFKMSYTRNEMHDFCTSKKKIQRNTKRIALVKYLDSRWFGSVIFELVSLSFRLEFEKNNKTWLLELK